jgi:hypothetical protein
MKFGKRSDSDAAGAPGASVGGSFATPPDPPAPPLPPLPESPPPEAEHEVPGVGDPTVVPPVEELPVVHAEPVVEGEAFELFSEEPLPETLTVHQHEPAPSPQPFPVAEQPVAVVTPGPQPAPVTTLGDSGAAFASGHAAGPPPSWQEPMQELAAERPELVVAAAFVGGLLAAMILRRLGN